ncbi:hypothetical protein LTR91_015665 [Friedmanniomyces endolithicus]|uniref:Uncharacterized protein n=1 Tax=Friedmanniomyces endolithicus TaxID=329885 RepID=A0AAN6K9F4_9PEZI|nr:hypothetical protein LTR57_013536 [Friedmanniomyces endolithicus]KAK0959395.1 hypothetical protein LTS01_021415 [Friedmanniomyces endolithicus]KAK0971116.1 hypothetical protein LTR91_015665 [Friedmanniomyces endolithicus]KAK1023073.1 hypothetical protein LTS16_025198 [Friedmanniomyces endolithicus]
MNTPSKVRSVGYGWGVLVVAGAGSYYFAKRSINADREERAMAEERRRQQRENMRTQEMVSRGASAGTGAGTTTAQHSAKRKENAAIATGADNLDPSRQVEGGDPAPVTHEQTRMAQRGRYEAAEPYKTRGGDRFS